MRKVLAAVIILFIFSTAFLVINQLTADKKGKAGIIDNKCVDCNVILFSLDTLRADRLGCYGHFRNTSPYIDELAGEGIIFSDVLAHAPETKLSHLSIFTSKYVFAHQGKFDNSITLAEVLKDAGYQTAAFTDGGRVSSAYGFAQGFDIYNDKGGRIKKINPRVIEWLRKNHRKKFFLFIHTYDVHAPYNQPEPYSSMFVEDPEAYSELRKGNVRDCTKYLNRTGDSRPIGALYEGGVRYVDSMLGRLFEEFDELGLNKNTIVVITSDHGESLGEHTHIGHDHLYDNQLRVPLIMRVPGYEHNVVSEPAQLIDLYPTVLGFLGITPPEGIYGIDLVPTINYGFSFNNTRTRISENNMAKTIRVDDKYKLIVNDYERLGRSGLGNFKLQAERLRVMGGSHTLTINNKEYAVNELYDLDSDREEMHNIIDKNHAIADSLAEALSQVIEQKNGTFDILDTSIIEKEISNPRLREQLRKLGYID